MMDIPDFVLEEFVIGYIGDRSVTAMMINDCAEYHFYKDYFDSYQAKLSGLIRIHKILDGLITKGVVEKGEFGSYKLKQGG